MQKKSFFTLLFLLLSLVLLSACSPKFNWREIKKEEPSFTMLFPEKPSAFTREIQLGEHQIELNMLAVDVERINFSLAYAKINKNSNSLLSQKERQQEIVKLMQAGMLKNINGTEIESKIKNGVANIITAEGHLPNGQKVIMYGKFYVHNDWVMQAIILGEENKITVDNIDMFFNSLKLN